MSSQYRRLQRFECIVSADWKSYFLSLSLSVSRKILTKEGITTLKDWRLKDPRVARQFLLKSSPTFPFSFFFFFFFFSLSLFYFRQTASRGRTQEARKDNKRQGLTFTWKIDIAERKEKIKERKRGGKRRKMPVPERNETRLKIFVFFKAHIKSQAKQWILSLSLFRLAKVLSLDEMKAPSCSTQRRVKDCNREAGFN